MDTGAEGSPELVLSGHGNKVNCCDWHPQYSLLASGRYLAPWNGRCKYARLGALATACRVQQCA